MLRVPWGCPDREQRDTSCLEETIQKDPNKRATTRRWRVARVLQEGESIRKRKVAWFIGVIVFVILTVPSILPYNACIAETAERVKRDYGIRDAPDVEPFWTTPSGRLLTCKWLSTVHQWNLWQ